MGRPFRHGSRYTLAVGIASLGLLSIGIGACGNTPPANYPTSDAGAGGKLGAPQGAEVGVADGAGTSGLSGTAKEAYERAFKAWTEGDLDGAKKGFAQAAAADPKFAAPHYSLGVVLERLGDFSAAQEEYRTAFSLKPDHEIAMGAFALSLANTGHLGEADAFLTEKKSKLPESPRITTFLAEVKSMQKDHGTAQQLAQDALRMNPDFKEAMVTIARDHYRARKMELAKYALKAILEGFGEGTPPRDKGNAEAHLLRGIVYREEGRRALALADFEIAYARRPDLIEASLQLGAMKLEAGNAVEALPILERAVRFAPKSAAAHLDLGDAYRLMGRPGDAKRELEQALALESTLAVAHYNLGLLYLVAQSVPGMSASEQSAQSIKEFETYKTMRGGKFEKGDDTEDLLNRAKAKQAELKNAAAAPPPAASSAAPASSGAPASSAVPVSSAAPASSAAPTGSDGGASP